VLCASMRTCESIAACHVKGIGIACEVEQGAFVTISKTDRDRPKKFPPKCARVFVAERW
jgi:hypothetical protein